MNQNRRTTFVRMLCVAVLGLFTAGAAQAQTLELEAALVSSGAGTGEAGSLLADLSIGQPAVGRVAQGTFEVELGFAVAGVGGNVNSDPDAGPLLFELAANYPNPFTPSTTIAYTLPEATAVRLDVFDVLGRRVRTLVDREQAAGHHTVPFVPGPLASGLYVYRLVAGGHTATRRMQLVRN